MAHLNEQELAQYVDALMSHEQGQLPEYILGHVKECLKCKVKIIEVWELMENDTKTIGSLPKLLLDNHS